jgi:hypothetical protein
MEPPRFIAVFTRPRHSSLSSNSTKQSPSWEADSHSTSQAIPRLLCIPKVHYRFHNSPSLVTIQSKMKPLHTFPP